MTRIIDSHCHIYPDKIAMKAAQATNRFYDGLSGCGHDGTVASLRKSGEKAGITQFVVHSVPTTPAQVSSINHFIAKSMQESEGVFIGLGTLHPDAEKPEEDFDDVLKLGLKGIKLHPDIQRFQADAPKAFRLYEMIEASGIPLLIHAGDSRYDYSNPDRILHIMQAFPKLKLVAAHLGGYSVWEEAARVLPGHENLWVDTSSSFPMLAVERAREIIRLYGSERVMFGTDYPLWTQDFDLDFMIKMQLTDEEYENIYWKTCAQLYQV